MGVTRALASGRSRRGRTPATVHLRLTEDLKQALHSLRWPGETLPGTIRRVITLAASDDVTHQKLDAVLGRLAQLQEALGQLPAGLVLNPEEAPKGALMQEAMDSLLGGLAD